MLGSHGPFHRCLVPEATGQVWHLKGWCPNTRGWNLNQKREWEKGWSICCGPFESHSLKFIALLKIVCLVFKVHFPPPLNFKVEGDTVTFSFEMRSGREHNTPDKAMWGFACTVRAQVLESNHCCDIMYFLLCALVTYIIFALETGQNMSCLTHLFHLAAVDYS